MAKPKIIVLEGPDGVGKSTQVSLLADKYQGIKIIQPSSNNEVGFIRNEVKENHKDYTPFELQCLHTISHIVDVNLLILRYLSETFKYFNSTHISDKNIIMDRSHISTFVYGKYLGISEEKLNLLMDIHKQVYNSLVQHYDVFIIHLNQNESFHGHPTDNFEKELNWNKINDLYHSELSGRIWFTKDEQYSRIEVTDKSINSVYGEIDFRVGS